MWLQEQVRWFIWYLHYITTSLLTFFQNDSLLSQYVFLCDYIWKLKVQNLDPCILIKIQILCSICCMCGQWWIPFSNVSVVVDLDIDLNFRIEIVSWFSYMSFLPGPNKILIIFDRRGALKRSQSWDKVCYHDNRNSCMLSGSSACCCLRFIKDKGRAEISGRQCRDSAYVTEVRG